MPIEDKSKELTCFYVSDEEMTPIDSIQEIDFTDTDKLVSAFDNFTTTIQMALQGSVNELKAIFSGVNVRVAHLIKYGKTKRVRKKNMKRFVYTRL